MIARLRSLLFGSNETPADTQARIRAEIARDNVNGFRSTWLR